MTVPARDAAELLHTLGYLYSQHGKDKRGLALLLIAARVAPNDAGVMRTLAASFVANGAGDRALAAIDRVAELEGAVSPTLTLLRARALWESGRRIEARAAFRDYVAERNLEREPEAELEDASV
jgi:type III secretion protein Y